MGALEYGMHIIALKARRENTASPFFTYKHEKTLASGAVYHISWESQIPRSRKYLPFTSIAIFNRSTTEPVEIYINQNSDNAIYVAPSQTISADIATVPHIRGFSIFNAGTGDITTGEIVIQCKRDGASADGVLGSIAEWLTPKQKGVFYG